MKYLPSLFLTLLLVVVTGCQTTARRLEVGPVRNIVVGQTKMPEVEKQFGRPFEKVTGADGTTIARYYFREARFNNDVDTYERREHPGDIIFRTLTLLYGPSSTIERKLHDESLTPVRRYNGWYLAGPIVRPENLSFIRTNATAKAELLDRLGEPSARSFDHKGAEILAWISLKGRRQFPAEAEVRHLMVTLNAESRVKDFAVIERDLFQSP